jgi:glutathione S-transferase
MLHRLILNADHVPDPLLHYAQAQWKRPCVQQFVDLPRPPA